MIFAFTRIPIRTLCGGAFSTRLIMRTPSARSINARL